MRVHVGACVPVRACVCTCARVCPCVRAAVQRVRGDKKQCVDAAVLVDPAIDLRGYVEKDLGNLALDVALLKDALKGISDVTEAAAIVGRWRCAPVESLVSAQDVSDSHRRSLRRRMGTVQELMRRLETSCAGKEAVLQAALSLLAMCSVLCLCRSRWLWASQSPTPGRTQT